MTIWVMEVSRDGGRTWRIEQPYHLYMNWGRGKDAETRMNDRAVRFRYRLAEFVRKDDGRQDGN